MLRILITETVFILLECITHIKIYKAPWAPPGFKVSLSLVEYGVKNFRKCFICRKSCNEGMVYYNHGHGLHTSYISLCCRMNPAFHIPFLWLIIGSAESSKMFHFPKLVSTVWNLQFSLVTIFYLENGAIYVLNVEMLKMFSKWPTFTF